MSAAARSAARSNWSRLPAAENCAVSAVQATHESKLPYYGAVGGRLVAGRKGLYEVSEVLEKPTPTEAEQRLIVPGLRAGHYLCFFGMHVLTPAVMDIARRSKWRGRRRSVHLITLWRKLAQRERYLAVRTAGPPLRYRGQVRPAHGPDGTGAGRAGSR